MRAFLLLVFLCALAHAESYFTAMYEKTGVTSGAVSIQQPASPLKTGRLIGFQLYSSAGGTFTFDSGAAANGSTSSAIAAVRPGDTTKPTLLLYLDSNAAAPSVPINKYVLAAGETKSVFFEDGLRRNTGLLARSAGLVYTVRFSSASSGDIKVTPLWCEE